MTREGPLGSLEHVPGGSEDALEAIREEVSPTISAERVPNKPKQTVIPQKPFMPIGCCIGCKCVHLGKPYLSSDEVEKLLIEKEEELTAKFSAQLQQEIDALKERAEFILQNEQVRASYMLREAHRERQEKIGALQTQLECKNLAGLMYVMCTERKRSKIEKMTLIEEYTGYILALQDILSEAQDLILNLSRGYKTAARVDHEWRQKMAKTLAEFQIFVHDFAKGTPESDQYFFDLPKLLKTEASIYDDPLEDPCTCDDEDEKAVEEKEEQEYDESPWYERLDNDCRPFVMFGDMADFKPPRRREVLRSQKQVKSAPKKWKQYVFHEMFVMANCSNADAIKDEYPNRAQMAPQWECSAQREMSQRQSTVLSNGYNMNGASSRRATLQSLDVPRGAGNMGSILKMITSSNVIPTQRPSNKAMLLGARDSMEIVSNTKVRDQKKDTKRQRSENEPVVLNIGARRTSLFPEEPEEEESGNEPEPETITKAKDDHAKKMEKKEEDENDASTSALGSIHNDSLTVIPAHRPDHDHKIHYEKVCPMDKCQLMHTDSFVRSLPSYMRASPFTHFEQSFENYEACSPEQIEILRQRIESKKRKEKEQREMSAENPLDEWKTDFDGVAVQTSSLSVDIPPCTCRGGPAPTPTYSNRQIFDVMDLLPMKQALNQINRDCFYDEDIEFNRFKVVGHESSDTMRDRKEKLQKLKTSRLQEVTKVLKQHPSLLDLFQANTM